MSLIPSYRGFNRFFDEIGRDLENFSPAMGCPYPYWLRSNDHLTHGNTSTEVVNNSEKFGVNLDVSHFKPEELKVSLASNVLTVEGNQELKDEHSHMHRSFTRKWTLPADVDLDKVNTKLDKKGHLIIEAPKKNVELPAIKNIPIQRHK